jgi:hypothetical protein
MKMLLEVVKDGFDLWSASEQLSLALGHELFLLFVVWWCQDECSKSLPHFAVQWLASVAGVTNGNPSVSVHEQG